MNARIVIFLISFSVCSSSAAQVPPFLPEPGPRQSAPEELLQPQPPRNYVVEYEPNSVEKKLLAPSVEDQQQFAEFLRRPDTGMIRMFPPGGRRVISARDLATGRRPGFGGYASLYSFSKEKHGNSLQGYVDPRFGWAELRLWNGRFLTGFTGDSLGVLVALGDVPLESVTPETYGVTGLTNIIPPTGYLEAMTLSRRNRSGFALERFRYGSSLPVRENMTYALRATSNKRADVLVGFRVVQLDENGSVTLIWRKLKVYPKPAWKRRSN